MYHVFGDDNGLGCLSRGSCWSAQVAALAVTTFGGFPNVLVCKELTSRCIPPSLHKTETQSARHLGSYELHFAGPRRGRRPASPVSFYFLNKKISDFNQHTQPAFHGISCPNVIYCKSHCIGDASEIVRMETAGFYSWSTAHDASESGRLEGVVMLNPRGSTQKVPG